MKVVLGCIYCSSCIRECSNPLWCEGHRALHQMHFWALRAFGCHCPFTVALVASSSHAEEWVNWTDALFGISGKGKAANCMHNEELNWKAPTLRFSCYPGLLSNFFWKTVSGSSFPFLDLVSALSLAKCCCHTCYSPLKFKIEIFFIGSPLFTSGSHK